MIVPDPMMTKLISDLTGIAADLARGTGVPSCCSEDHPLQRTRRYWLEQLREAENTNKELSMRLRVVIDKLSSSKRGC